MSIGTKTCRRLMFSVRGNHFVVANVGKAWGCNIARTAQVVPAARLTVCLLVLLVVSAACGEERRKLRVAGVTTVYYHNSHADLILGRLLEGDTLDGKGPYPDLELVSLYVDQTPENDKSRGLANQHKVRLSPTVRDSLTLGTDKLAVDGVLLIAEHGKYPESATGQIQFPKRKLFEQVVAVFEASGRVVPVFMDKHLADNWQDAKWIYDTARRLQAPLMAGSSVPVSWRRPEVDVRRDSSLEQIVVVSYHRLDAYGFHALEAMQALAERRGVGETGVKAVQCLMGDAVWDAGEKGLYDPALLQAALDRQQERPLPKDKPLKQLVKSPVLFTTEYRDGLRAHMFTLDGAVYEWAAAWRYRGDTRAESTLFWTQEARPFAHFTNQMRGIESLMYTGQPAWPVERTLLVSGLLDAGLLSKTSGGRRVETPYLNVEYRSTWQWRQPAPPPPGRSMQGP
jgi:hypothetical protein